MISLLTRMKHFLAPRNESLPREIVKLSLPKQRDSANKQRDPKLEARARDLVRPVAPALCDLLVVGWNSRMRTTAGVAIASRSEIWLNPALRAISETEIEKTLLHELAHLVAQHRYGGRGRRRVSPHGAEWREACADLGIPDEKRTHQLPFESRRLKRRYALRCPVCGESHERVHLPQKKVACLACCRRYHGGRYHERFRLEVIRLEPS